MTERMEKCTHNLWEKLPSDQPEVTWVIFKDLIERHEGPVLSMFLNKQVNVAFSVATHE
jgi:hypothetical protein